MMLIIQPAAVGLALVARPLAEVMVGEQLRAGAAAVTPWIAASGLFAGLTTYYFHQAFTLARRTRLLLAAMSIPAAANIALNVVLIPRFGLSGAMWATTASYAIGLAASWALGRRIMPLPVPWTTLSRCVLATVVMALAVALVPATGGLGELLLKACGGAAVYGALALILDIAGARSFALRALRLRQTRIA
jgi:O-antigen/teichoic acid export membrane protein